MPAVELMRLRGQINELITRFGDPLSLRSGLRDLLDLYTYRAYRAGQGVQPQSLLPSYRVAPLVMRQLELELGKTCQEQPEQALNVVDALWEDPFLEPRLLATTLLGAIPASQGEAVVQKLRDWGKPSENFRMLDALFRNGTTGLRRSAPDLLLKLFEEWITSSRTDLQALGIRALVPMIEDPAVENIPPFFRLLSPLVQTAPAPLQSDLQAALAALTRRTSTETAYFLRQTLSMAAGTGTARLVRHCLPIFGPQQQASLRAALRTASSST